jgi:hypothetical protein
MASHILVKYASRSRPDRFFEGLHNLLDYAANKDDVTVFCILDRDDHSMFQDNFPSQRFNRETTEHAVKFANVIFDWGESRSKIHAINRPIPEGINWDILVNFSDDMRFTVNGWDEHVREGFRCNPPDAWLHYPDSTAKNMLSTMSIMDKAYYAHDGYIYHPSYQSLWCDNEAQEVAKMRGRYIYMGTQIFDHYHPAYGHVPWDEQYLRQQKFWNEDELLYIYRKSKNFCLHGTDKSSETEHPNPDDSRAGEAVQRAESLPS